LPHLESHQGPIAYRAIALTELCGSIEALQPSQATPDRCLADVAAPTKPRCAVRGVFIPGGKIVAPPAAVHPPAIWHAMSLGRPGAHRLI